MTYSITRGKIERPQKIVMYGVEGIGKSTFATHFPRPLFIDTEGGSGHLDIPRLPRPESWAMLLDEVKWIRDFPYECGGTLVIDTIDWAQTLCTEFVCAKEGKKSIEDFGYGTGYTKVHEEFGRLLNLLTEVTEKGLNVLLLAHASIERIEQPGEIGVYDHWGLKLQTGRKSSTSALVKEWADAILFCNWKTMIMVTDDRTKKASAQGGRLREIHTNHSAAFDAKNRYGLADTIPMEWSYLAPHIPVPDIKDPRTNATPETAMPEAPTPTEVHISEAPPVDVYDDVPFDTEEAPTLPDNLAKLKRQIEAVGLTTDDVMEALKLQGYVSKDTPFEALATRDDLVAWIPTVFDGIKKALNK